MLVLDSHRDDFVHGSFYCLVNLYHCTGLLSIIRKRQMCNKCRFFLWVLCVLKFPTECILDLCALNGQEPPWTVLFICTWYVASSVLSVFSVLLCILYNNFSKILRVVINKVEDCIQTP